MARDTRTVPVEIRYRGGGVRETFSVKNRDGVRSEYAMCSGRIDLTRRRVPDVLASDGPGRFTPSATVVIHVMIVEDSERAELITGTL